MNGLAEAQWTGSVDEDYAFFINNLKFSGSSLIFQPESDWAVVYDFQNQSNVQVDNTASSEKQISKLPLHKEKFNCREHRYSQYGKKKRKNCAMFRSQIKKILGKPYDKEEYPKLLSDITVQKPQHKHLDLRSGKVRFIASEKIGKSFIDHHGDLKQKVKAAAKDDGKQLNLLRGFFFWIENLTQEGSFIPWNDEECLNAARNLLDVSLLKFQYISELQQ